MVLDLVGHQILLLAADDAAVLHGAAQLGFVLQGEGGRQIAFVQPLGHGDLGRVLQGHRHHRQGTDGLAQEGQQIVRLLGGARIHHHQVVGRVDPGESLAGAAEGTRQQGVEDLLLERFLLFLLEGPALLELDRLYLLRQHLLDHGTRQHFLLLAGTDEDVTGGAVGQGGTEFAKGLDPPETGHVLTATRGKGAGLELGLQLIHGQVKGAGKAINLQVFKPHGVLGL